MKTLNKIALAVGLGVMTAVQSFAAWDFGDTGTITLNPGIGNASGGGAFTASTSGLGTFYTFCLEMNETLMYGTPYTYTINSGAVKGGVSTLPDGTPGVIDPLSIGTAYLFNQWFNGLIANTADNANALQIAIWSLEGEISTTDNATADGFLTQVGVLFGDATLAAAPGAYGVVVLNLTDAQGNVQQDVLGIVPEPSAVMAGALLLLPFAASTIRILRKKREV